MNDVTGMPQTAVVIGGGSEIACSTMRALARRRLTHVALIGRAGASLEEAAEELRGEGLNVEVLLHDVTEIAAGTEVAERARELLGSIDLVLVAAGFLGEADLNVIDDVIVARTIATNFTGPAALMTTFAKLLSQQGYGRIVVLSSVAGVRVRKANFVYGSAKAGLDGFAQGLDDALVGSGVSVMIVRPGFVHSKMTRGLSAAPLATTPEAVAGDILRGLEAQAMVVWSPAKLQWLFHVLIHLPRRIWRMLPG